MSTISSWADLPEELLSMIGNCLKTRIDNTRFRSVCTSWRSSTLPLPNRFGHFPNNMWLTALYDGEGEEDYAFPYIFHTTFQTMYCLEPLAQSSSTSTNQKWLIVVEEFDDGKVRLLNPFYGFRIHPLPSIFLTELNLNFHIVELQSLYRLELDNAMYQDTNNCMFRKLVPLRNSTYDESLFAVMELDGDLSFHKVVNKEWIRLHHIDHTFQDIASYKGKVCAIRSQGQTMIVDSSFNICAQLNSGRIRCTHYLVESSEDLYLVERYETETRSFQEVDLDEIIKHNMETDVDIGDLAIGSVCPFKVYKLHEEEEDVFRWIEVTHIGGQIFFLGEEAQPYWSVSVSSHQIPGCKGNCIFFIAFQTYSEKPTPGVCYHMLEDTYEDCFNRKLCVFDMETGRCGLLGQFPSYADMFWPPPDWVNVETPSE